MNDTDDRDAHRDTLTAPGTRTLGTQTSGNSRTSHSLTMLKGLTVLEYVASRTGTLSVGEVAEALTIEKSTVSRLLSSLRTAGYVRQGADRRYQLTSKLLFLTRNFIPAEHLRDVAREAALGLHRSFDEAIHVAALDGGEIVFVDFLESPLAVRIQLPTVPAPLHLTAIGRAMLAQMSDAASTIAVGQSEIAAGAALTDAAAAELEDSLERTRQRGYAVYNADDDVTRLAAAIVNESGEPVGGISVSGPSYRVDGRAEAIGHALVAQVAQVRG